MPRQASHVRTRRTPDAQFANLPDFPFAPHYVSIPAGDDAGDELRVHYVDEGDPAAPAVLLMHGEPSWSFLYRHMIPVLVDAGLRTIAPDLVGFGRSDKPVARGDFTYARHVAWMRSFLDAVTIESKGGFELAIELSVKADLDGRRLAELPTTWRDRTAGESRFKLRAWLPLYLRWYLHLFRGRLGRGRRRPRSAT